MDVVPAVTPATANAALEEPASIAIGVCTVATAGSLLVNEILAPPIDAGAVRLTVPCTLLPAATLVAVSATLETLGVVLVGALGELEPPHCIKAIAAIMIVASVTNDVGRRC
jgi:hypothetical protein